MRSERAMWHESGWCGVHGRKPSVFTSAPGLTGLDPTPLFIMISVPRKEKVPPLLGDNPQRLAS